MIYKFIIPFVFCIAAAPFFLVSVLSEVRRAHVLPVIAFLVITAGLSQTSPGHMIFNWFAQTDHLMLPLIVFVLGLGAWVAGAGLIKKLSQNRLSWRQQPRQTEFSSNCASHLYKSGWVHRGDIKILTADIFWMNKKKRFVTFIFFVARLDTDAIRRAAKQIRREFFDEVIVVGWTQPSENLVSAARSYGWHAIGIDELKLIDSNPNGFLEAPTSPMTSKATEGSWEYLRRKAP